jgi:hypothetical protein
VNTIFRQANRAIISRPMRRRQAGCAPPHDPFQNRWLILYSFKERVLKIGFFDQPPPNGSAGVAPPCQENVALRLKSSQ